MTENTSNEATDTTAAEDPSVDFDLDIGDLSTLPSDCVIVSLDADGCIAAWNDGARHLLGYDAETIVGTHFRTLFPPEVRDAGHPERVLERARSDGTVEGEGWRARSDGSRFWADEVLAAVWNDGEIGSERTDQTDGDLRGYVWVVSDRTEERERIRELREEKAFAEHVFEAQPDVVYAFDADGNHLRWNDRLPAVTGYTESELAEMSPVEFIAPDDRDRIAAAIRRILEEDERVTVEAKLRTKDGRQVPYEFNSARITGDDGTVLGFTGVGRDITDRKARERELERLERLNAIIRRIDETVVAAETREEVETAVVEEFAAADAYRFAVIGRADAATVDDYSWEPVARAGIDAAAAESLSSFVDPPSDADVPSALETRTAQRYRALRESPIEVWRRHAREQAYDSVAVVPIVAGDRPLGALVIGADEPSAFADREREVLQEFGGTVGHAINATTVRRLLYQDVVVELEFQSTDRGDACIKLSDELGCVLSIEHVLPLTDELFVYYFTVSNCDHDRMHEVARDDDSIAELRLIDDDENYWECVVRGPTIEDLFADYGARLQSKAVREGVAELTVQVSPDADLRGLVSGITSAYPDTRLRSKQTVERPVETHGDFRRTVESMLTDKQRIALEAAYHGGYFEWPTRNSDASEVADRLDIARQTFHQHLRVALAKLLSAYFGATD